MGRKATDLSGKIFGRLKVIKRVDVSTGTPVWLCRCYCGNPCDIPARTLVRKVRPTRTCGNCNDHIKYKSEWTCWRNLRVRCNSSYAASYKYYGQKGIQVCSRWEEDFLFFLEDMGLKEYPEHTIERKDSIGNYCKENCYWLHKDLQFLNTSRTFSFVSDLVKNLSNL